VVRPGVIPRSEESTYYNETNLSRPRHARKTDLSRLVWALLTVRMARKNAIPVLEETLSVGKRAVQHGMVRVHTRVSERPVQEQVTLNEERAVVERRPVNRPASEADLAAFKEGEMEIRETSEKPVVSKSARVVEEVSVGKQAKQRTETVKDSVRRTDVDVQRTGGDGQAKPAKRYSGVERRKQFGNYTGTERRAAR